MREQRQFFIMLALIMSLGNSAFAQPAPLRSLAIKPSHRPELTFSDGAARVTKSEFGKTSSGLSVDVYMLHNANNVTVKISTLGATIVEANVPDKKGDVKDVVLGFDSVEPYETKSPYFGATVGRYANRIAGAQFKIGENEYKLAANNGKNTLHGGKVGFDKRVWDAQIFPDGNERAVKFSYLSKDGEEGFPGNLMISVTYSLLDDGSLKMEYSATTDKTTPINITNHAYFNLAGVEDHSVLDQTMKFNADAYTPVNSELIPTGSIAPVKGTPMDFRTAKQIGKSLGEVPGGYDHNFVFKRKNDSNLELAAFAEDPKSGRSLTVMTTEPGIQFYTGNFLDGTIDGIGGKYQKHCAFTLEAQHFPDSVHQPGFPDVLLHPGERYSQTTVYKFGVTGKAQ